MEDQPSLLARWLAGNLGHRFVLACLGGILAPLPGPNIFFFYPAGQAIWQSLFIPDPFGLSMQWVGLGNFEFLLSDRFYTLRQGRYVLPVRADAHERVVGLVHGSSASGATIFVEPRALIPQGNRLKLAQAEQEREEARILGELTGLVRERLASLRVAFDGLIF